MIEQGQHISDEMIVRYLSGKATSEEEAAVLDYLAESDEHLDDLLAMSAAIEDHEASSRQDHKTTKTRPLWPILSAVASVALLLIVGLSLWHYSQSGSSIAIDSAPAYATQDTLVEPSMEDSL